ncbi:serine/threonine/tyrosine-interacting-like protein 1, partial [Huso huso]
VISQDVTPWKPDSVSSYRSHRCIHISRITGTGLGVGTRLAVPPGRIKLYNILNQCTAVSRLCESNYLCLIDARPKEDYDESHIITAKRSVKASCANGKGEFLPPVSVELECMKYCIVYDGNTVSLEENGPAFQCAQVLQEASRHPIRILNGGYEAFSAYYPFFRTQKILYMPQELEDLHPYPVEILPGQLYLGTCRQACDRQIQKDLKIKAHVNVSEEAVDVLQGGQVLHIPVSDLFNSDLYPYFKETCNFLGSHLKSKSAVLVFSSLGMAFLILHHAHTLQGAWKHVLKCKTNMRPQRGFVRQLSKWEEQVHRKTITDISDPHF